MNDLNTQLRRNAANDEAHRLGYSIEVDLDTNLTTHTAIAHRLDAKRARSSAACRRGRCACSSPTTGTATAPSFALPCGVC